MKVIIQFTNEEMMQIEQNCDRQIKHVKTMGDMFKMVLDVFELQGLEIQKEAVNEVEAESKAEGIVKPN